MIDKEKAKLLHNDINMALKAIAEKHGLLSITTGTFSYDRDGMFFKLSMEGKVDPMTENGGMSQAANGSTTANILHAHGVPLNSYATIEGRIYRVVGWTSKRRSMPVDLMNVATNTMAKASVDTVKFGMTRYLASQVAKRG